jgi:catechol 2,3-dioxygenase-like lactoylglutathione lyase family enzyme
MRCIVNDVDTATAFYTKALGFISGFTHDLTAIGFQSPSPARRSPL